MTPRVHLERDGEIAVIVIDNPPINAGSAAVRQGLMTAIETYIAWYNTDRISTSLKGLSPVQYRTQAWGH
jgi:transposase InsO family protein